MTLQVKNMWSTMLLPTRIHIISWCKVKYITWWLNMYCHYWCIISSTTHLQIYVPLSPSSPCIFIQWFTEPPKRYVELPGPTLNELSNITLKTPQLMTFTGFHPRCNIYSSHMLRQSTMDVRTWLKLCTSLCKLGIHNQSSTSSSSSSFASSSPASSYHSEFYPHHLIIESSHHRIIHRKVSVQTDDSGRSSLQYRSPRPAES